MNTVCFYQKQKFAQVENLSLVGGRSCPRKSVRRIFHGACRALKDMGRNGRVEEEGSEHHLKPGQEQGLTWHTKDPQMVMVKPRLTAVCQSWQERVWPSAEPDLPGDPGLPLLVIP